MEASGGLDEDIDPPEEVQEPAAALPMTPLPDGTMPVARDPVTTTTMQPLQADPLPLFRHTLKGLLFQTDLQSVRRFRTASRRV